MKKINKDSEKSKTEKVETVCQILTSNYNYEYMDKDETLLSISNTDSRLLEHKLVFDLNEKEILTYLILWLKGSVLDDDTKEYITLQVNYVINEINNQFLNK